MIKLSKRLQLIADQIPERSVLADIGSDHALLPCYLASRGFISKAIAGEISNGPLEAAARQIHAQGLDHLVEVRLGDGLAILSANEVDVITIAGMGGNLITHILSAGLDKLDGVRRLVLQPNVGEEQVRKWLYEHHWALTDEYMVAEDGKIYEVLIADRRKDVSEYNDLLYHHYSLNDETMISVDMVLRMGPHLLRKSTYLLSLKWKHEISKLEQIQESLKRSMQQSSQEKFIKLSKEIEAIREVLYCLQKDRLSSKS